jgi:hypothetical protein
MFSICFKKYMLNFKKVKYNKINTDNANKNTNVANDANYGEVKIL